MGQLAARPWQEAKAGAPSRRPSDRGIFVAAVAAAVATLVLADLGPTAVAWAGRAVFATLLAVLAIHDWRTRRLPNRLVYPAIFAAAVLSPTFGTPALTDAWLGVAVAAGACLVLIALSSLPALLGRDDAGLGGGDLKLTVLLGLLLGWRGVLIALWAGTLLAALPAAILIIRGQRKGAFAFGPCLVGGAFVAAAWLLAA